MEEFIANLMIVWLSVGILYFVINTALGIIIAREYNKEAKIFNKKEIDLVDIKIKIIIDMAVGTLWLVACIFSFIRISISKMINLSPNKDINKPSFKQWYLNYYFNKSYKWEEEKIKEECHKEVSRKTYYNLHKDLWVLSRIQKKYKYITRDENGVITVHKQRPVKIDGYWFAEDIAILPLNNIFNMINTEDVLLIKEIIPIVQKAIDEYKKNNNYYKGGEW